MIKWVDVASIQMSVNNAYCCCYYQLLLPIPDKDVTVNYEMHEKPHNNNSNNNNNNSKNLGLIKYI
jgi:hypothetical protein